MMQFSDASIKEKRRDADQAVQAYIQSLYALVQCAMSSGEAVDAQYILTAVEKVQNIHATLEKTMFSDERAEDVCP